MKSDTTYRIELSDDCVFPEAVQWVWSVFVQYCNTNIGKSYSGGQSSEFDILLSGEFWGNVKSGYYGSDLLAEDGLIEKNGDLLATAFYFLNCLWERDESREKDVWGRSEFQFSLWREKGFEEPILIVNEVFDRLADDLGISCTKRRSILFLSHDIDAVYSAWMEDGKAALKKGKIGPLSRGISNKLSGKSSWFNFIEIAAIEKQFNYTSTFYWIAVEGNVSGVGKNADYNVRSEKFVNVIAELSKLGMNHGVHKSIADLSLKEEVDRMPIAVESNRYHYLKFNIPQLIEDMSKSKLKMDASLGYAEVLGYRNGYSLPFIPFDLENKRAASFIEVPLCIMDATLSRYMKLDGQKSSERITKFINEHENNAVISILWHNTHFTNYKYEGYPEVYRKALQYAYDNKLSSLTPEELIKEFYVHK